MNEAFYTWDDLAAATCGEWLASPPSSVNGIRGVVDDSRRAGPGTLFVAIAGEITDGHRYIASAVQSGAGAVCVETVPPDQEAPLARRQVGVLRVRDSLQAFQALARAHRRRFPALPLVGLTGSCGKTSTKEMIARILEAKWPNAVLKTAGNTNNHFGVPRNLLRLAEQHSAAVIELGTNHPGEIDALARIAEPTVGAITTVGRAHLEFLGSLEGVAREKAGVLRPLPADGTAVIPGDSPFSEYLRSECATQTIRTFGCAPHNDVVVSYEGAGVTGSAFVLSWPKLGVRHRVVWQIGGGHQALNAACAAAVAFALGVAPEEIARALPGTTLPGMRTQILERDGIRWLNDAYNANPDSTAAALAWFAEETDGLDGTQRLLVLGDMLELGDDAPDQHRHVLRAAADTFGADRIVAVGALMQHVAGELGVSAWPDADSAREGVLDRLVPGMSVLLKGSRGIGLEVLIPD